MEISVNRSNLQTIFVILALIAASCQCSMACAIQSCMEDKATSRQSNEQLPPCHQHRKPKSGKASHGCLHTPFLIEHRAPALVTPELTQVHFTVILPEQSARFVFFEAQQGEIPHETSPPHSPELAFSTVLRL